MKVLITGATGLVGEELTKLLLQNGFKVHYLTTSKKKIENQTNYQGFYWNPKLGEIDIDCLLGVDAIIHLAGSSIAKRWTNKYKQEIIESRVLGATLLYTALKSNPHQVKQIVSASAVGIYPDSLTNNYSEEFSNYSNTFLSNVVIKWEDSVDQFSRLGLHVCKIRIGLVLSNNGGVLSQLVKPIRFGLGAIFGSGKQWQSWIHIKDLVRVFAYAIENNLQGIFNAVAPNPVSHRDMMFTIARKLHKPLFVPNIPKIIMKLILGEMHTLLFESQKVSSVKIQQLGFQFKYDTIDKALDELLQK